MGLPERAVGVFQKVGECLYRYSSNGVYYARVKVHGKEIRRSLGTIDRDLAKRRLSVLKQELSQTDRSKSRLTLAELCDQFLKTVQHQKAKTVERKTHIVARIKRDWPSGSTSQVSKIKPSDVQLWLARYSFGPVSRNLHLAELKRILNIAVADGVITRSPAENIAPVKQSRPIRETPTFDEFKAIVADIRSQRLSYDAEESADFVEFLGLAGLGQAEATSLRWSDIDWERGTIRTFRHKTQAGFVIPLYPQLKPLLERRKKAAHSQSSLVFRIKSAKKAITGVCRRHGLPNYSHRSFRRMFITRAIERGVDVKVIAEWQGHKDGGKLILDTYSHVNRAHSQRMAQLMSNEDEPENVVQLVA
jgi:integrase